MNLFLKNKYTPLIILLIISIIFTSPIYQNTGNWGQFDWDQHLFYNAVPRSTILDFNQFPLWNPYYCGGNPMLANPQSMFLNPFFLLVLLFGTVLGIKLSITLHLFIGLYSMYLLSRYLNFSTFASYFTSFVFMLSTWYSLRMMAGHLTYFAASFIPFVFLFYLKSFKNKKYIVLSALFLALMVFAGGVYPVYFTILLLIFYSIFRSIKTKNLASIKNISIILILFLLFGAVKIFPSYIFLKDNNPGQQSLQYYDYNILYKSFFSRQQNSLIVDNQLHILYNENEKGFLDARDQGKIRWDWHEYGSYIGFIPLILFLSSFIYFKRKWPLILTSLIFLIITLGNRFPVDLWSLLRKIPYLSSLHGHSRFSVIFVFTLALLSGFALNKFYKKIKFKNIKFDIKDALMIVILLFILINLFSINHSIYQNIFIVQPPSIRTGPDFLHIISSDPAANQYPNFLQNLGTVNCYERVRLPVSTIPIALDNGTRINQYRGNAYFLESNDEVEITEFSPNKIKVKYNIENPQTLVLNFNYHKGWKSETEVFSQDGLIATNAPVKNELTFYYLPTEFIAGLIISIISIPLALILFFNKKFRKLIA